ncbi:MAG: hypothetical protein J0I47_08070 [Sphingomonas sp.]|uniref:hypothetical protein n=1 Tax=Sphingomonas sp. TaxID=28214 RepID=UPI001AC50397|nr:hypothetical protein [Sphingomonas sp.]MBN8808178.1 hypothetical protein [Sphingomonas sp.]
MIDILRILLPGGAFVFLGFVLWSVGRRDGDRPAVTRTRTRRIYAIIIMLLGVLMIALHFFDR